MKSMTKIVLGASCGILAGLIALIFLFGSMRSVPAGNRGILIRLGAVQERILPEGLNFKWPLIERIVNFPVNTWTVSYQTEGNYKGLAAATKDVQDAWISVVVNFHPNADDAPHLYRQYGTTYLSNVIEPAIRGVVKTSSAKFNAEELITKRGEFEDEVSRLMEMELKSRGANLESVDITNILFSDSFSSAIEAKVTAQQDALTAKNKLEQVKFEAQQKIETAKADAEAIRIQASAITSQGGADYVKLQAINKWDGKLPVTNLGASTPIIDLRQ